jgi:hypothetical protein
MENMKIKDFENNGAIYDEIRKAGYAIDYPALNKALESVSEDTDILELASVVESICNA